ncbi:ABC transporter permease [Paenibacillus eucommiae]|uniref:Aldouronate transport system permease protein n=1 Tax=Paenibacillus eucommiae TaxID=1355755 RepID=A0ABS4IV33_9BACL|nr:ABC transporter permease subunit [Paenibacillus eucommiae]MBP1990434.1 putative aldouronate transport system permease protein [Paenibacillus eucommiae]
METNLKAHAVPRTAADRGIIRKKLKRMKMLYLMLLLPVVHLAVFHYAPMYGVLIAFKDYRPGLGIWASPWNNFEHFRSMLNDFVFLRALRNTFVISLLRLVFGFTMPILFALLLNELRTRFFKRTVQSISYLPHFLSWVIVASMVVEIVSPQRGVVNYVITLSGGEPINFLSSKLFFLPLLLITDVWKEIGWASIIYLASIASISPELYEAAESDGANRFQKMIYITIPSLLPVITILFLLRLGNILSGGFDQILNLYNPLVYEVADIIDTYVYRVGLLEVRFDYSAAVGLFKNVVGVILLVTVNQLVRKHSDYGVW